MQCSRGGGPLGCSWGTVSLLAWGLLALCALVEGANAGRKDLFFPPMPRRQLSSEPLTFTAWAVIVASVVVVVASAVGLYLHCRGRGGGPATVVPEGAVKPTPPRKGGRRSQGQPSAASPRPTGGVNFTLDQISQMTSNWDKNLVIEDAGHASVHLGRDNSGNFVAIKRAKKVSKEGNHMFRNEVAFLAHVKHTNIMRFIGNCDANAEQILVFEYIPNGNLATWLRPPPNEQNPKKPLNFSERLKIAIDVAEALTYMHSFTKPTIIHRDVKSDTILLDDSLSAKLGGLGLLKHLPGEAMRIRMDRKKGYLDPEYFQTFKVTTKCDVYAFGVVLLEMVTGRAPLVKVEQGEGEAPEGASVPMVTLPQWTMPAISGNTLDTIVDPRMPISGHTLGLLTAFAQVAAACVAPLRKDRPDIGQVLELLKEIKDKSES